MDWVFLGICLYAVNVLWGINKTLHNLSEQKTKELKDQKGMQNEISSLRDRIDKKDNDISDLNDSLSALRLKYDSLKADCELGTKLSE